MPEPAIFPHISTMVNFILQGRAGTSYITKVSTGMVMVWLGTPGKLNTKYGETMARQEAPATMEEMVQIRILQLSSVLMGHLPIAGTKA